MGLMRGQLVACVAYCTPVGAGLRADPDDGENNSCPGEATIGGGSGLAGELRASAIAATGAAISEPTTGKAEVYLP